MTISYLRAGVATFTGAVVTILLAYLGAIVLLVVRLGHSLGSGGGDPTGADYLVLLLIGAVAAATGGHIAAGIARQHSAAVVMVQAAFLACGALWGFTGPASQWPGWWAPALAAVLGAGTWVGGLTRRR